MEFCPDLELESSVFGRSDRARIAARYGDFMPDVKMSEPRQVRLQILELSTTGREWTHSQPTVEGWMVRQSARAPAPARRVRRRPPRPAWGCADRGRPRRPRTSPRAPGPPPATFR